MNSAKAKVKRLERRRKKIKSRIKETSSDRSRLCISKSNKCLYAQIIDDVKGHTLVAVSTFSKDFSDLKSRVNKVAAKKLGVLIAQKAKTAGCTKVVFDRNGLLYHGKIKEFADSARENGMEF